MIPYVVEQHDDGHVIVHHCASKRAAHELGRSLRQLGKVCFAFPAASPFRAAISSAAVQS